MSTIAGWCFRSRFVVIAAVGTGRTQAARVITATATIMICVFLTFSFMGQRDIAEFGIGLAVAVAVDAFVLRIVLVPAAMHLFGDANQTRN